MSKTPRATGSGRPPVAPVASRPPLRAGTISEAFDVVDPQERKDLGLAKDDQTQVSMVVELNLFHLKSLSGARESFLALHERLFPGRSRPILIANTYYRCKLSVEEARLLVNEDQKGRERNERCIHRVWPDFRMKLLIDRSISTIKADAARRSYDATGDGIVWAVIDSGIQQDHPHFKFYDTLKGEVEGLHRDFTLDEPALGQALEDKYGHGTHVAGIIAGGLSENHDQSHICVGQRIAVSDDSELERIEQRRSPRPERLAGVAPACKLVSLKVLDDNGEIRSTDVLRALEYVRAEINGHGKPPLRVHGVNLSIGYDFNAKWFACGQSPVCVEVDRLVRSGVVVVVAAGNTGYGEIQAKIGTMSTGLSLTINDPGNAELAITVGSTHRDSPHTYGVSYFSSKGPTGDGRLKPDVVAPGERILSCAVGRNSDLMQELLDQLWDGQPRPDDLAVYLDDSGTSMAAPHVSGAIAAFLSIRREFIGRAEQVKKIFLDSATSLSRESYFEGHGLIDLMRAIQSV